MKAMKNQIFNWNRFTLALRKEVTENWRQLGLAMLVLYAVMTLIMVLGNWMTEGDNTPPVVNLRYLFVFLAFSVSSIVMASLAFRGLMTKTGRTELFMSPSSMTEKFIVNVLIYVVGYTLAFIIITQLADLTRIAVLWSAQSDTFNVPGPINFVPAINEFLHFSSLHSNSPAGNLGILILSIYLGLVANAGAYLLGSVLWPRLSFLKTYAAIFIIETVIIFVGLAVVRGICTFQEFAQMVINNVENGRFAIMMLIFSVVQLVRYWVLAWVVFRRKDVVSQGIFK